MYRIVTTKIVLNLILVLQLAVLFVRSNIAYALESRISSHFSDRIRQGSYALFPNWLSGDETKQLRDLALRLYEHGLFKVSGLRSTPTEDTYNDNDRLICDEIPEEFATPLVVDIVDRVDSLRFEFAELLSRPTLASNDLDHESKSCKYIALGLHLDERHEELRPANRWQYSSRRSLSWLLYLNDESWDSRANGGEVVFSLQRRRFAGEVRNGCGASMYGDLQIGWLWVDEDSYPVYLQSKRVHGFVRSHVYYFPLNSGKKPFRLTDDFSVVHPQERNEIGFDFYSQCMQLMALPPGVAFVPLEAFSGPPCLTKTIESGYKYVEVYPLGGSLLVFDSVCVPHSVKQTTSGMRIAIGGWWHEAIT